MDLNLGRGCDRCIDLRAVVVCGDTEAVEADEIT